MGLILEIYRDNYDGGPINKFHDKKHVTLVDEKITGPFDPDEDAPAVKIKKRFLFGQWYLHVEPAEPGSYAFGGSYVATSDSRFRYVLGDKFTQFECNYPLPLHDRQMNLE